MLAALTRIDRHESCFAASKKEAPAKVDSFDRGFPTKGVIAGYDLPQVTLAKKPLLLGLHLFDG
jgi:hypothetical protein